jgi:hypothetical protein
MWMPMILLITIAVNGQDDCSKKPQASKEEVVQPQEETVEVYPLEDLAWMVGTWIDEGEDSKVVTECSWAQNGRFLKRSFSVLIDDEVTLHGDQFIGWDPIEGRIRSWTFDSEGGIGEGRWYQDDNRWLVKTTFRLATGEMASATNIITYIDDDTATWQSIGREIAGELLPSIPEVNVVRQQDAEHATDQTAKEKS